jgi:hypothetical protein
MTIAHIFTGSFGAGKTTAIREDSAYRRDSRLEIVLGVKPTEDLLEAWRSMLCDAALTPRD